MLVLKPAHSHHSPSPRIIPSDPLPTQSLQGNRYFIPGNNLSQPAIRFPLPRITAGAEYRARDYRLGCFGGSIYNWDAMSNKKGKKKSATTDPNERSIAENRKARHKFSVLDTLECGIVLVGSEVKSLRNGRLSLNEAYGRVRNDEVWLVGSDIAEYNEASRMNHDPKRPRKLLLHRREIRKFANKAHEKGLTLVPLKMYFKNGRAKVLLGLCQGKKQQDKREALRTADTKRDIAREMRRRSR